MTKLSDLSNFELECLARARKNPYYLTLRKMAKFHVAFYVLVELESTDSYTAERAVQNRVPTIDELQDAGLKVRSKQWTVTELTEEDAKTFSRPAE